MYENYEKEFSGNVATKKAIARDIRCGVMHSGCALPADTMSSVCREYDMAKPWNWAEFISAPHDIQQEYLAGLGKRFFISKNQLPELFSCTQPAVDKYLESHQLVGVLPPSLKSNLRNLRPHKAEWEDFAQSNSVHTSKRAPSEWVDLMQALEDSINDAKRVGVTQAMLGKMIGVAPCIISKGKNGHLNDATASLLLAKIKEATNATEYKPLVASKEAKKAPIKKHTRAKNRRRPSSSKSKATLELLNDVNCG